MGNAGKIIGKITDLLAAFHSKWLSGVDFMYFLAIIIGLLCGVAAGLLHHGIDFVMKFAFSHFNAHSLNLWFLLLPIVGIFIASAWMNCITRHPMDHACKRLAKDVAAGNVNYSPKLILGPIITCSITLGLGGSAGAEGPISCTGAAIGSNVGKAFKMPADKMMQLVGCGAAAATAGIFMAPIGGVMFTLEVLKMKQSLNTVIAIVLSSLVGGLVTYIMLGCNTCVSFVPEMRFDLRLIPWVIGCGILCGFYSLYYGSMMMKCRKVFLLVKNIWLRALSGGLVLAALLVFFPSLYGEGYRLLGEIVGDPRSVVTYGPLYSISKDYNVLMLLMLTLLMIKPLATSATNDSGGVGGNFTPTFYCGGVLGCIFAMALNHYFHMELPTAIFAFFGMAAVMAGALRAPLMAIFISAEMTGLYGFILPLTLAALASYGTCVIFSKHNLVLPFLRSL